MYRTPPKKVKSIVEDVFTDDYHIDHLLNSEKKQKDESKQHLSSFNAQAFGPMMTGRFCTDVLYLIIFIAVICILVLLAILAPSQTKIV